MRLLTKPHDGEGEIMPDFHSEFLQIPPQPNPLAALAQEYHERTEAYDRFVCTGPIVDRSIMPASSLQQSLISSNALTVKKELGQRAISMNLDPKDLLRAIVDFADRAKKTRKRKER